MTNIENRKWIRITAKAMINLNISMPGISLTAVSQALFFHERIDERIPQRYEIFLIYQFCPRNIFSLSQSLISLTSQTFPSSASYNFGAGEGFSLEPLSAKALTSSP